MGALPQRSCILLTQAVSEEKHQAQQLTLSESSQRHSAQRPKKMFHRPISSLCPQRNTRPSSSICAPKEHPRVARDQLHERSAHRPFSPDPVVCWRARTEKPVTGKSETLLAPKAASISDTFSLIGGQHRHVDVQRNARKVERKDMIHILQTWEPSIEPTHQPEYIS